MHVRVHTSNRPQADLLWKTKIQETSSFPVPMRRCHKENYCVANNRTNILYEYTQVLYKIRQIEGASRKR